MERNKPKTEWLTDKPLRLAGWIVSWALQCNPIIDGVKAIGIDDEGKLESEVDRTMMVKRSRLYFVSYIICVAIN